MRTGQCPLVRCVSTERVHGGRAGGARDRAAAALSEATRMVGRLRAVLQQAGTFVGQRSALNGAPDSRTFSVLGCALAVHTPTAPGPGAC